MRRSPCHCDRRTRGRAEAHGIAGEVDGRQTIASPLLKQKFFLDDGQSLQDDDKALTVFDVRLADGEAIASS